jgi:hypothetical protein
MKKCAVIIGVNKTGRLPALSAAVSGAKEFAQWATGQGFDIKLHTDEQAPVNSTAVRASVRAFVDAKAYSLMVIFFAGHGILKSATDEQWQLSDAPDDPNEAVNVQGSRMLARKTGIPHIVFISDACRSVPNDPLVTEVSGSVIFPNLSPADTSSDIDMLYATMPGSPAYEAREDVAIQNYKGLYTTCLLEGLSGKVPGIISKIGQNELAFGAVLSYELKEHLKKAVPEAAEKISLTLKQNPDGEVTSRSPKYLARIANVNVLSGVKGLKHSAAPGPDHAAAHPQTLKELIVNNAGDKDMPGIEAGMAKMINAKGRESFETRTGFTVIGESDFHVIADPARFDLFQESGVMNIRIRDEQARTIFIALKNRNLVPLAVLQGFIGTVVVDNDAVLTVNYTPSRGTPKYNMAETRSSAVEERRALITTAAHLGLFRPEGDPLMLIETASYLRNEKAFDPTLGLYAAYAYAQAGNAEGIRSILEYMQKEPEPVLFDVTMLGMLNNAIKPGQEPVSAPFCPLLTQGWSYLSIDYELFNPVLKELARYLVPGLWTTFNEKGSHIIFQQLDKQAII